MFLEEIFQNQPQTINDWPDPSHKKTDPTRVKNFWHGHITMIDTPKSQFWSTFIEGNIKHGVVALAK